MTIRPSNTARAAPHRHGSPAEASLADALAARPRHPTLLLVLCSLLIATPYVKTADAAGPFIAGLESRGNELRVRIKSSLGVAGCVDVFSSTNLLARTWAMIGEEIPTGNDPTGIEWPVALPSGSCLFVAVTEGGMGLDQDPDGDGIPSGRECLLYGTDPFGCDTDGDGLGDGDELRRYGTCPTRADTDGDSLTDGWEVRYGTDPAKAFSCVEPLELSWCGMYTNAAGSAQDIFVGTNGLAYIANGTEGLVIVDVRNPSRPVLTGHVDTAGAAWEVMEANGLAYVADGTNGLRIFGVANPASIVERGGYRTSASNPHGALGLDVAYPHVYLAAGEESFYVIDVSDPDTPSYVARGSLANYGLLTRDVTICGALMVEFLDEYAVLYDLGSLEGALDPEVWFISFTQCGGGSAYGGVVVSNMLYGAFGQGGVHIVDVSDPWMPEVMVQSFYSGVDAIDVAAQGRHLFLASAGDGLQVFDIGNADNPQPVFSTNLQMRINSVCVKDSFVYLAADTDGMVILEKRSGDIDSDGLPDAWERTTFTNLNQGAAGDFDGDGINNMSEYMLGTNPTNTDSDADGLRDGAEIAHLTDPRVPDTDGDGLCDGAEVNTYGSNPLVVDSDGDGLSDWDEVYTHHTDPAKRDTDGDGGADNVELAIGTSPLVPDAYDRTISGRLVAGDLRPIVVLASLTSDGWSSHFATVVRTGADFIIPHVLRNTNLWLKAFWDVNGNGALDDEVRNAADSNPVVLSTDDLNNVVMVLSGADYDQDGLPDDWEWLHFRSVLQGATADADGDGLNNLAEYLHGTHPGQRDSDGDSYGDADEVNSLHTDPTNSLSYPITLVGSLAYGGRQTGNFRVVAATNSHDWASPWSASVPQPGPYSVQRLPAGRDYWIKGFRDSNNNGICDSWEAIAILPEAPACAGPDNVSSGAGYIQDVGAPAKSFATTGAFLAQGWTSSYAFPYELPFAFPFAGSVRTNCWIDQAGRVVFSPISGDPTETVDEFISVPTIAPLWNYTKTVYGGIYGSVTGDSATIRWEGTQPIWGGEFPANFSVTLHSNGNIRCSYGSGNVAGGLIGVSAGDGIHYCLADRSEFRDPSATSGLNPSAASDATPYPDLSYSMDEAYDIVFRPVAISGPWMYTGTLELTDPDLDADQLPDWWEIQTFGNTNAVVGVWDCDEDGQSNLAEYQAQTDPKSAASKPAVLSGMIAYSGIQPGTVRIVASTSNAWSSGCSVAIAAPGAFSGLVVAAPSNYWVRAYRDSNGNGRRDYWEACGEIPGSPLSIVGDRSDMDFTLSDPAMDADRDGLPDWWEMRWFGWIHITTGLADSDQDGLSNIGEYEHGTLPLVADSDADGWSDGEEVNRRGTDPLVAASCPVFVTVTLAYTGAQYGVFHVVAAQHPGDEFGVSEVCSLATNCDLTVRPCTNLWLKAWVDANADGIRNPWEACGAYAGNPLVASIGVANAATVVCADPDTDDDRMPDWWEMKHFGNLDSTSAEDADGDGTSNRDEYANGLDPRNGVSRLAALAGDVTCADSLSGTIYVVAAPTEGGWASAHTTQLPAPGAFAIADVPAPAVYWVKAFRDANGNGVWDSWEPAGVCDRGAMAVKATVAGLQIAIGQTDADRDGMPDEWERQIVDAATGDRFTSIFNVMPDADFDADGVGNAEEYRCGTSPTNGLSLPPRLRFACLEESVSGTATTQSVWLLLSTPSACAVTAEVSRVGGSATPGADFVLGDTVVAFAPAQTAAVVQIAICGNAAGEPAEDVLLGVRRVVGPVVVGTPATHRVAIVGDEADADGDGLPDWWEALYFSSPTAAVPTADPDGDGWDNAKEFSVGANPGVPYAPDAGNVLQLNVTTPMK